VRSVVSSPLRKSWYFLASESKGAPALHFAATLSPISRARATSAESIEAVMRIHDWNPQELKVTLLKVLKTEV